MIARKFFFIVIILIIATLVSAQGEYAQHSILKLWHTQKVAEQFLGWDIDDPGETQRVGDVANSNPFDEAVNHDVNDGNKAQNLPVINTTGSIRPPAMSTRSNFDDYTPVTVTPSPSVTMYSAGQNSVPRTISQTSFLVRLAILLTAVNLVNCI